MVQPARQLFTFEEYLALEAGSPVRHEFLQGLVWAMAGGSPDHAAICVNITSWLSNRLRDRHCRVYSSDLRVRVRATGLGTYPDATVICGRLEADPEDARGATAVNPCLIVEVLSPSTESYDRGEKLFHYKQIPGLDSIVLVAQDRPEIEVLSRQADGSWSRSVVQGSGAAELGALGVELPLAEVYRNPLA